MRERQLTLAQDPRSRSKRERPPSGLGNNPFNPAMLGYAFLLISYPLQMTQWPSEFQGVLGIFEFSGVDVLTGATNLDYAKTQLMLGLGMSSISDSWYAFAQNNKSLEEYEYLISQNEIPVFRGHLLTGEDLIIRKHILNIMCHFQTSWKEQSMQFPEMSDVLGRLKEMESDGLVIISNDVLEVPDHARPYIRNICMAFDLRLLRTDTKKRIFSMTI